LARMIRFEQVTKRYGERVALDAVSWSMEEGEKVALVGSSGAGKTTILKLITHERQPSSGTVSVGTFHGGSLSRGARALLRRTLGIVYEDFRLLHDRTVLENVALAVRIAGNAPEEQVLARARWALDEVGLELRQEAFPMELSAGEKQRAAIARAIVNRPAVVLADEPTGALSKKNGDEVLALLSRVHSEGAALLVATTRHEVAEALGARVLHLEAGRLVGSDVPAPAPGGSRPAIAGAPA
jgi:ABC-type ATPase involved in cell division